MEYHDNGYFSILLYVRFQKQGLLYLSEYSDK